MTIVTISALRGLDIPFKQITKIIFGATVQVLRDVYFIHLFTFLKMRNK